MAKVCIICEQVVTHGKRVEDDIVIQGIRRAKQALHIAKNNELMVCDNCVDAYAKKREKYEKNLVMHVIIASLVLLAFILLPLFTSGFSLWSLVLGALLAVLIMALSTFSHTPRVEGWKGPRLGAMPQEVKKPEEKKLKKEEKRKRK